MNKIFFFGSSEYSIKVFENLDPDLLNNFDIKYFTNNLESKRETQKPRDTSKATQKQRSGGLQLGGGLGGLLAGAGIGLGAAGAYGLGAFDDDDFLSRAQEGDLTNAEMAALAGGTAALGAGGAYAAGLI